MKNYFFNSYFLKCIWIYQNLMFLTICFNKDYAPPTRNYHDDTDFIMNTTSTTEELSVLKIHPSDNGACKLSDCVYFIAVRASKNTKFELCASTSNVMLIDGTPNAVQINKVLLFLLYFVDKLETIHKLQ